MLRRSVTAYADLSYDSRCISTYIHWLYMPVYRCEGIAMRCNSIGESIQEQVTNLHMLAKNGEYISLAYMLTCMRTCLYSIASHS